MEIRQHKCCVKPSYLELKRSYRFSTNSGTHMCFSNDCHLLRMSHKVRPSNPEQLKHMNKLLNLISVITRDERITGSLKEEE